MNVGIHDQRIRALLTRGEAYLREKGVPNARRNVEWMLAGALECRAVDLYVHAERTPRPAQIASFIGYLERRGTREPLQYILESTEFMSLPFNMSPGVFIPRPDTEVLIEKVETTLCRAPRGGPRTVLDLCCGSGVVGISIVKRLSDLTAVSVDISEPATVLTARNAMLNGAANRVRTVCAEATEFLDSSPTCFDAIVSNPPYVPTEEISHLAPEIQDYEPFLSLDGGRDGLDFYRRVVPHLRRSLNSGGVIAFEIGASQGSGVATLLRDVGFERVEIGKDYAGQDRVIVASDG